jgi:hypothetical protein
VKRLRAWRTFSSQNRPGYDHMRDVSYDKAPVCDADVDAALDELEQLWAENAILLDGNQRLQTMNDGLRQMAIQAREAAEGREPPRGWPSATRLPPHASAAADAPTTTPACAPRSACARPWTTW